MVVTVTSGPLTPGSSGSGLLTAGRRDLPGTLRAVDPLTLSRAGITWRATLAGVLAVAFLAGTAVGQDTWWPFGPWRMYATATPPTGGVAVLAIEVLTADGGGWRPAPLTPSSTGLNRAEIEGRIPAVVAAPELLGALARTHSRLRPQDPAWVGVRVVRVEQVLVARRPTGEVRRRVVVTWPRP